MSSMALLEPNQASESSSSLAHAYSTPDAKWRSSSWAPTSQPLKARPLLRIHAKRHLLAMSCLWQLSFHALWTRAIQLQGFCFKLAAFAVNKTC